MTKFIPIDEYTSPVEVTFNEETLLNEIEDFFSKNNYRHAPILKDGKPVGLITQRDLYKAYAKSKDQVKFAKDIMIVDPVTVPLGSRVDEVAFLMNEKKIGSVLVVNDNGDLDGIFTSIDGLNALIEILRDQI